MARSIDERIVQMTFNNEDFERKAKQTIGTLNDIKEKTNESFSSDEYKKPLLSLADGLDRVELAFAGFWQKLGSNIADFATKATTKLTKALTDPIEQGWGKYTDLIASQQKIMSAVEGKTDKEGNLYDMDAVSERLEKLQWYADETSYSMTQMTNAIGDFTASGRDLDESVEAIMGIANACADAGVSTQRAESAFTAFSKAIGSGQLTLGVWNNQLKTSGLTNSERFRESLLNASANAGFLTKTIDGTGKAIYKFGEKEVNTANLTDYLNDGLATTDVILEALKSYSDTVNALYSLTDNGKLNTEAEVVKNLTDALAENGKTLADYGLDQEYDTTSKAIKALTKAYNDMGIEVPKSLKAFGRAQEAISFTQAIDSAKEAIQSSWSSSFELIFGNYEESKKIWTDVANDLWSIFAEGGVDRNEILKSWKDMWQPAMDAQSAAMEDMYDEASVTQTQAVWRAIAQTIYSIKTTISDIWNSSTDLGINAKTLFNIVESIRLKIWDIYNWWNDSESSAEGLKKVLSGIFSAINMIVKAGQTFVTSFINPLIDKLKPIAEDILSIFGDLGDILFNKSSNAVDNNFSGLVKVFETLLSILDPVIEIFKTLIGYVKEFSSNLKKQSETTEKSAAAFSFFGSILDGIRKVFEILSNVVKGVKPLLETIGGILSKVGTAISTVFQKASGAVGGFLKENSATAADLAEGGLLGVIAAGLIKVFNKIKNLDFSSLTFNTGLIKSIKDTFNTLTDSIKKFTETKIKTDVFSTIAKSLLILAAALFVIAMIDTEKLKGSLGSITLLLAELIGSLEIVSKIDVNKSASTAGKTLKKVATALLLMAIALKVVSTINADEMKTALIGLTVSLTALMLFLAGTNKLTKYMRDDKLKAIGSSIIGIGLGLIAIATALKIMSSIELDKMGVALLGLGVSLAAIMGFIIGASKLTKGEGAGKIKSVGSAMVGIGIGLIAISAALKIMSTIDIAQMGVALLGLVVTLGAIFGFAVGISKLAGSGNFAVIAASMLLLAPALLVIAGVLKILGTMEWKEIGRSLTALVGAIAILTLIPALIGLIPGAQVSLLAFSASLLILVPALLGLVGVLKLLSGMEWKDIGKGLGMLAAVLGVIGTLGAVLGLVSPLLLLFSVALTAFGASLLVVSKALGAASLAIIAFNALGGDAVKTLVDIMTTVSGAIVAIIPSILLGIVEAFLSITSKLIEAAVSLITVICNALIESIPKIVETVVTIVKALNEAAKALFPILIETALLMFESLLASIRDHIGEVIILAAEIVAALVEGLGQSIPILIDGGFKAIIAFINGLAEVIRGNSGELGSAIGNLASAVIEGIAGGLIGGLSTFGEKIKEFGSGIIGKIKGLFTGEGNEGTETGNQIADSVKSGLEANKEPLLESSQTTAMESVQAMETGIEEEQPNLLLKVEAMTEGVTDSMDGSEDAAVSGQNTVNGLLSTLTSQVNLDAAFNAGFNLGDYVIQGYDARTNTNSPSKEMAKRGVYAIQGLIQGLKAGTSDLDNAGEKTGGTLLDSIKDAIDLALNSLSEDLNPVITPVLDLSGIRSGATELNNLLNQNGGYIPSLAFAGVNGNGISSPIINIDFNINNEGKDITDIDINKWSDILIDKIDDALGKSI